MACLIRAFHDLFHDLKLGDFNIGDLANFILFIYTINRNRMVVLIQYGLIDNKSCG